MGVINNNNKSTNAFPYSLLTRNYKNLFYVSTCKKYTAAYA